MRRKSGVLMHISSLPGRFSCGSFGENAKKFIDFLKDCGFSYWQVLPFCPIDEYNSSYKSHSTFAGNPYFVDLEILHKKGLLTATELNESEQKNPYLCEYERLRRYRLIMLMRASKRAENIDEIEKFIAANPHIERFCRFMALKSANANKPWQEWTNTFLDEDEQFMWKFIQYEFFAQWAEVKKYANQSGMGIIGDVPFYVASDSSDVWANRDLFCLDEKGYPDLVAGVPPDYFSEDGQLWGNPLYNWEKMREDGYKWWCERVSWMLNMFDGLRIDHFRAFESYWAVNASEKTARNGNWIKGPGMDIVKEIRDVAWDKLIIAEDLGHITKAVEQLVAESGFFSMRVFQFGFFGGESTHMPHNYKENSVAYSGTHDNNTLLGYLWETEDSKRRNMLEYCGYDDSDWTQGLPAILRTIWQSHSGLVIFPVQDLLGFGSDTRMNFPGRAENNWSFRVTEEQLEKIEKERFRKLNELYCRM